MIRQNIFLIIFILLLAGLGYFWYQNAKISPPGEEKAGSSELEIRLSELRRLKDLKLDTTLFQNPLFRKLEASTKEVPSTPASVLKPGRSNPFIPF